MLSLLEGEILKEINKINESYQFLRKNEEEDVRNLTPYSTASLIEVIYSFFSNWVIIKFRIQLSDERVLIVYVYAFSVVFLS